MFKEEKQPKLGRAAQSITPL